MKKIYKGTIVQTADGDIYKIVGDHPECIRIVRWNDGKQDYENREDLLTRTEVARDLGTNYVVFELTTEEKKEEIKSRGLSVMSGKELNDSDRDENGDPLNRHCSGLYYIADDAGNLKTWEQTGSITEEDAIEEAYIMILEGEIN